MDLHRRDAANIPPASYRAHPAYHFYQLSVSLLSSADSGDSRLDFVAVFAVRSIFSALPHLARGVLLAAVVAASIWVLKSMRHALHQDTHRHLPALFRHCALAFLSRVRGASSACCGYLSPRARSAVPCHGWRTARRGHGRRVRKWAWI
eukprot:6177347-Pleurochrysis_carterae.AAC.3